MDIIRFITGSLVVLMFSFGAHGQDAAFTFGDISLKDFETGKLPADTAEAIFLFDIGKTAMDHNSTIGTVHERHLRIKILKTSALNTWGNFKILSRRNTFRNPKGATYNSDKGSIVRSEITEGLIQKTRFNKDIDEIAIAFPNVKVGSVIELTFVEKEEGLYLHNWKFQHSIPSLYSEYTMHAPVKDYTSHLRGSMKPSRYEEKYEGKYRSWVMTDIPGFRPEPLMPDKDVYISALEFSGRYNAWVGVYNALKIHPNFWSIVQNHNYLKNDVKEITAGFTTPLQIIKSISDFVKRKIVWDGTCDYLALEPKEIFEKKSGSAGDINLLFASMLEKAGFKVNLVLLSTRSHGFILEAFPSPDQFDYVLCQVELDGKSLMLDATEKYLPFDVIPSRCMNHKGFLFSEKQFGWIGIEPIQRNRHSIDANFTLTESGSLIGKLNFSKFGYAAFKARKEFNEEGESEYKNSFASSGLWDVSKSEVKNIDDIEKPVTENHELTIEDYATVSNDLIYLNPHIFLREETNPFIAATREFPIDYEMLTENVIAISITIPAGYKVESLPESKVFGLSEAAARCTFSITQSENTIKVITRFQINRTLFQPDEYQNLKEFYARVVDKKSENIVLKRK